MKTLTTIATCYLGRLIVPAILMTAGLLLPSCNDSGVDSETAQYIIGGEEKDTTKLNLQKAYIEAGIIGEAGNVQVGDFIEFGRVTEYRVDSLADGTVVGLRDIHLKATFGDADDPSVRHNFYPLRELQFRIPVLSADGPNGGPPINLQNDPDQAGTTGGLRALFFHNGVSVPLVTRANTARNNYAQITGVDATNRTIGLYVWADLTNPIPRSTPNRIVDRMVVEIILKLPY